MYDVELLTSCHNECVVRGTADACDACRPKLRAALEITRLRHDLANCESVRKGAQHVLEDAVVRIERIAELETQVARCTCEARDV